MMFGLKIQAYRKKLGLTQVDLAELIHVSIRTIKYWESDKIVPKPATMAMIERFLDFAVLDYKLAGMICPISKDIMKERFGGGAFKQTARTTSKLKEVESGTSGDIKPNSGLSKDQNSERPDSYYEEDISFGR